MKSFENQVLEIVRSVTSIEAYFFNGTLYLKSADAEIAVNVFNAIWERVTAAVAFCKVGEETSYDFL
jgi:hypothetical protein